VCSQVEVEGRSRPEPWAVAVAAPYVAPGKEEEEEPVHGSVVQGERFADPRTAEARRTGGTDPVRQSAASVVSAVEAAQVLERVEHDRAQCERTSQHLREAEGQQTLDGLEGEVSRVVGSARGGRLARSCPISWAQAEEGARLVSATQVLIPKQTVALEEVAEELSSTLNCLRVVEVDGAQSGEGWLGSRPVLAGGT
jgi:hypothetical protein